MGWVRVSDDFYDNPKFTDITPLSVALWIVGLAYCNRNLTDGYVPKSVAPRLCDFDGLSYTIAEGEMFSIGEDDCAPRAINDLVKAGLWHTDGHDCPECPQPGRRRYYVHDYLVYQPSAADIRVQQAQRSEAGKKGASARWAGKKEGK